MTLPPGMTMLAFLAPGGSIKRGREARTGRNDS
jgi:hypothetical protein